MIPLILLVLFAQAQAPVKDTIPGATNVTRVDATIACAGATSPEAFAEIKKRGFVSIVNLRREQEPGANIAAAREAASAAGLTYIHIPVDGANPDPAAAEAFIKAVTNPANQPAFIHCASANRVAAMWLIKRVVADGWTVERALEEAVQIGLTHEGLKRFAVDYATAHRK
jgi:uncharacterized protein (TIGR01244 family)